jgi:hypothetical protein
LQARVVDPLGEAGQVSLRQVAPGRYEALFTPTQEGAYFLTISGQGILDGSNVPLRQTNGWVMSYSPEYRVQASGANLNLLRTMASRTGGQDMAEDATLPFVHNLVARNAYSPLWPYLLLAVALLLPLDVAVRRLVITRTDLQRARQALLGLGRSAEGDEPSERISSLIGARQRGRQRAEESAGTLRSLRTGQERRRAEREAAADVPGDSVPVEDKPSYVAPRPEVKDPGVSTTGELLKSRRKKREGEDSSS